MSEFPSFLRRNTVLLCIHHISFIHSSVDGHLGYFHVLTVVNNNCCEHGNTGGQICLSPAFTSLGCIYGMEWLGHVFNFWGAALPFASATAPFCCTVLSHGSPGVYWQDYVSFGSSGGGSTSLSFPASRDHLHPLTSVTLPGRMESLSSFSSLSFHLCFSLFFLFILTIARKGLIGPPG